ncbi:MetQ/NlpA family ABC transporter substrate-binding protein [uncultured Tyzzerella sp.]|uniref:MetQ/NlpA family ABC transporter substrate-binding protein n=1 Tax=uncultured Tyzzerella sp. TaxID=2321398 RepID=UPI0029437305|nr:MetQ/NlpA family ABC transporter substrate-binding protein [uncultured Tyzzerella sp.]
MKKFLKTSLLAVVLCFGLTACGGSSDSNKTSDSNGGDTGNKTITVGATSVPHAEILNEVVDNLAEEGITLNVKEFSEYTVLNPSLTSDEIDANFFQHTSYLNNYMEETEEKLVSVGPVHTEPMGIYSKSIKSLDEIADKDKLAVPNDATNGARALLLLESNGIIKLKEGVGDKATIFDIEENPKNIEIIEMDAAALPRALDDVKMAVINTNYALEAGFNPMEDAISIEGSDSPFANILVVKEGNETKPEIQSLYKALTSDEIKTFIEEKYKGAVVPAF